MWFRVRLVRVESWYEVSLALVEACLKAGVAPEMVQHGRGLVRFGLCRVLRMGDAGMPGILGMLRMLRCKGAGMRCVS